jgi:hypothetical protein
VRTDAMGFSLPSSHACITVSQEVCAALNAVCKLTTVDTIPAVINDVIKLLKHEVSPPLWSPSPMVCGSLRVWRACVRAARAGAEEGRDGPAALLQPAAQLHRAPGR